jgi:hypothetical protein
VRGWLAELFGRAGQQRKAHPRRQWRVRRMEKLSWSGEKRLTAWSVGGRVLNLDIRWKEEPFVSFHLTHEEVEDILGDE